MAGYAGDIVLGDTIDVKFCTVQTTGAPFTLAGSPVISAYVGNSTTQITAGITLTVDFDGVTGLNNVRVVASGGNGFAAATNISLIITTGTVNSVSVVGYEVGSFSIQARGISSINGVAATSITTINANVGTTQPINFTGTASSALAKSDIVDILGTAISTPATAGILDVNLKNVANATVSTSTAQLGVNIVNFGGSAGTFASGRPEVNTTHIKGTASSGTAGFVAPDFTTVTLPAGVIAALGIVDNGTAQSATATTLVIRSAASFGDSTLIGHIIWLTGGTGVGQSRLITANVGSTDTVTVDTWTTTPDNTSTYIIFPAPPGSATSPVNSIRTGTLQSGSTGTTAKLDSGASATDNFYQNEIILLTSGTGAGQVSIISSYVGSTKVATVSSTWATTPDSTTGFALLPLGAIPGASAPTVAQIATAVWQDATAGDFTTSSSIGKSLYTTGNAPGAASGIALVGSNMGTVTTAANLTNAPTSGDFTATMKTSIGTAVAASAVASVTGNVGGNVAGNVNGNVVGSVGSVTTVSDKTGYALSTAGANAAADALLDRADAIETGLTVRGVCRLQGASLAGKASGLATTTAVFRNAVQDSKARITATVDADGNRSAVTTDLT